MSAQNAPTNLQLEKDQKEVLTRFTLAQSHTNFNAVTLATDPKAEKTQDTVIIVTELKAVLLGGGFQYERYLDGHPYHAETIALAIAKRRMGPRTNENVSYLRVARSRRTAETGARKVAREEAMARERQATEAAIARNNNRRTRSNGVRSKISTIPQAQAAAVAAATATTPELSILNGFESDCQPKDNQD